MGLGGIKMSTKTKELAVAKEHHYPLLLIYKIGNKIMKQSRFNQILLETGYSSSAGSISRLLNKLERNSLISRTNIHEGGKRIYLRKLAVQYLENKTSSQQVRGLDVLQKPEMRNIRTEFRACYFYENYVKGRKIILESALKLASNDGVSTLFGESEVVYEKIRMNYPILSLIRNMNFFLEEETQIAKLKEQQKARLQLGAKKKKGEDYKVPKAAVKDDVLTLEKLKAKNIFLTDFRYHETLPENLYNQVFHKPYPTLKPIGIAIDLTYFCYASNPSVPSLNKIYEEACEWMNLFDGKSTYEISQTGMDKVIGVTQLTLNIVFMNETVYKNVKRKLKSDHVFNQKIITNKWYGHLENVRIRKNIVNLSYYDICEKNEHLRAKEEQVKLPKNPKKYEGFLKLAQAGEDLPKIPTKFQTKELCRIAVERNEMSILSLSEAHHSTEFWEELCWIAVKKRPRVVSLLANPSEKMLLYAIKKDPLIIPALNPLHFTNKVKAEIEKIDSSIYKDELV